MPGVSHRQRRQDPADAPPVGRLQEQGDVVAHSAVAEQAKRVAGLGLAERPQEGPGAIGERNGDIHLFT